MRIYLDSVLKANYEEIILDSIPIGINLIASWSSWDILINNKYTLCPDRIMFIYKVFICSYTYFAEVLIRRYSFFLQNAYSQILFLKKYLLAGTL